MRVWLIVAALNGFIAVAAGAFGAHALQNRLDAHALQVFDTAARYQMYHALAMGLAAFAIREQAAAPAQIAAVLFLAGTVLFSGSLYLLALTGTRALAIVTPFGGLAFLLGWLSLAWTGWRLTR
ncbi:MAG TPA: DUF423 domain-containing protein [Rhizomicrobium sp.]|jgi:uncharacterized membrane protein YgdD (TMEM256/DUF423 family)|nr:DUF423 domain-containing protein [Rhizomicrobium sp.]